MSDFDQLLERYHLALAEFFKGNPEPAITFFSHREDVSLGNPFGPFVRGWKQVSETARQAATHYKNGEAASFENIVKYVASDFAYSAEVERCKAKVGGREQLTPLALRVTSIFRREEGVWKLVHRHADPITTPQAAESIIQK